MPFARGEREERSKSEVGSQKTEVRDRKNGRLIGQTIENTISEVEFRLFHGGGMMLANYGYKDASGDFFITILVR
jgi:hypothetical protein